MNSYESSVFVPILQILAVDLSDSPGSIAAYKKALKSGKALLAKRYRQSISAIDLTHEYARFIDEVLIMAWQPDFAEYKKDIALLAVGGYGRKELFPGSDIDLMILTKDKPSADLLDKIQVFLTFLWDIGLEVGHSVRSIRDTVSEAKEDVTVITNILEARLLKGSPALFEKMRKATAAKRLWPSKKFFIAKSEEQRKRYLKYEGTAYKLEPNIKESPGGLRDIQTIGWIAKRHFGTRKISILKDSGFLTEEEFRTLQQGQETLSHIRIGLHLLTGRGEDRLLFEHQRTLAEQLGFSGQGNKPIEQFMQQYYRTIVELSRLNEMLLQHFDEAVLPNAFWRPRRIKQLNRRFRIRHGYLEVVDETIFKRYPAALLEVFLLLQQHPELRGVRASTIRLIREYCDRVDDNFRNDPRTRAYFMEIFRQPHGLTHELRRMNRYGVLAAYLPEFENIVGRMQYDLFHAYTVDEHTLLVVRNLRRFTVPEFQHEFPLSSHIMATLPKPELIYITGLYHDIAKGRGGDHSKKGAIYAREFCQRHGLGQYDTDLVCWLVENHLVMSSTSQKQDISDPEVIRRFATDVADGTRLNYLYVLTVADMRATNPTLWNNWKATLLDELYNACSSMYRHGLGSAELEKSRLEARQSEARQRLSAANIKGDNISTLWQRLSDEYFLRHSVDDIVWQSQLLLESSDIEPPIVSCRADRQRGVTAIFIYANDQANLFAHSAAVLDQLKLNILDARIMETTDSYAMDTFIVHNEQGQPIIDKAELKTIQQRILKEIQRADAPARQVTTTIPRTLKQFAIRTHISFDQDEQQQRTLLRLKTTERPGILSQIGQVFLENKIRLHNARIATFGERVEDVFYITTSDKQRITDEQQLETLRSVITEALAGQE